MPAKRPSRRPRRRFASEPYLTEPLRLEDAADADVAPPAPSPSDSPSQNPPAQEGKVAPPAPSPSDSPSQNPPAQEGKVAPPAPSPSDSPSQNPPTQEGTCDDDDDDDVCKDTREIHQTQQAHIENITRAATRDFHVIGAAWLIEAYGIDVVQDVLMELLAAVELGAMHQIDNPSGFFVAMVKVRAQSRPEDSTSGRRHAPPGAVQRNMPKSSSGGAS